MLEVENLSLAYGLHRALDGVALSVNSGEIVRFEGNVVMNLIMESPPAPESEPEPAPPPRTRSVTGKSANTK
mgnify:CR=1 FL=1